MKNNKITIEIDDFELFSICMTRIDELFGEKQDNIHRLLIVKYLDEMIYGERMWCGYNIYSFVDELFYNTSVVGPEDPCYAEVVKQFNGEDDYFRIILTKEGDYYLCE